VKLTSFSLLLPILILGCFAPMASADSISIANPSFETSNSLVFSSPGLGSWNNGPIPGWGTFANAGSWQPGPAAFSSVPDGTTVAYSNGGFIYQSLGVPLLANTTYTLSVDVGHRFDGFTNTYGLALLADTTLLNSVTGSTGLIPIGTFADESLTFTSGANVPSGNLVIELGSAGPQIDFDNVRLTAFSVPEPGTLRLLAVGLGLTVLLLRRR